MKRETHNQPIQMVLVELALMLLLCVSMIYPFNTALALQQSLPFLVFLNLVLLAFWTFALRNRWTTLIAVLAIASLAAFLAILYLRPEADGSLSNFHRDVQWFISWARDYLSGYRSDNAAFARILMTIFCAIVTFVICFFTVQRFRFHMVALCGAAGFVSLFIIGHVIHRPSLYAFLLAVMLYYALHLYVSGQGDPSPHRAGAYVASLLPVSAVLLAAVILLSGSVRIDPPWMKAIRDKVIKKNTTPVHDTAARLTSTWVVSDDNLGGDLYLNDEVIMKVQSPVGSLHLKAQSKEYYTGHAWVRQNTTESFIENGTDLTAVDDDGFYPVGMYANRPETFQSLFQSIDLGIQYRDFSTGIIYHPARTSEITGLTTIKRVGYDCLMMQQSDGDAGYSLTCFEPQQDLPAFQELARLCGKGYYAALKRADPNGEEHPELDPFDEDSLNAYEEELYSRYTQLPPDLPERVKLLAQEITAGIVDDYGKAKAIAAYLADHCSYTLTPGYFNRENDFVDEFLFVNRKGYCTYYATAMAVLLRCADVPCRYVEGYVLPGQKDASGAYAVTKRQGHAWVEAYLEGIGWLTFDPTSSNVSGGSAEPTTSPSPAPTPSVSPTHTPAPKPINNTTPTAGRKPLSPALMLSLLILVGMALLVALAFFTRRQLARAMAQQVPRDGVLACFAQCVRLLQRAGLSIQDGETLEQFARRVDQAIPVPAHGFSKIAGVFQIARFSDHEITSAQTKQLVAFRKDLLMRLGKRLGLVYRLWYGFFWVESGTPDQ